MRDEGRERGCEWFVANAVGGSSGNGNTPQDTQGCILVGRNTVKGQLTSSLRTFNRLKEILDKADAVRLIIN